MLALKQYELSNHLGNVLATVLDRRTMTSDKVLAYATNFTGTTDGWTAGWSAAGTLYNVTPPTTVGLDNNRLKCTATISMGGVRKVINTSIGTAYTITMDIEMGTAEGLYIMPRATNGGNEFTGTNITQVYIGASGTYTVNFTATTSTTQLLVEKAGSVEKYFFIDNVKVEQSTPTLNSHLVADVVNAQYYYPFGSTMKTWKADGEDYRFSYNGGEAINEVYGKDNYVDLGERGVDTRLGRLNWTIDPRAAEYPWQSPYAYYANSPIWQIDFKGGGKESTHTDKDGKVLAVYDDGDKGIYKHDDAKSKEDIDKKYSKNNTSAGGTRMGQSLHIFSFVDGNTLTPENIKNGTFKATGKIDFNSQWAKENVNGILWDMQGHGLGYYAANARSSNSKKQYKYDIKYQALKIHGSIYYGSLLYGDVYASARDAGNFAAGLLQDRSLIPNYFTSVGFGAYNKVGLIGGAFLSAEKFFLDLFSLPNGPTSVLKPPYYGETLQSGMSQEAGRNYNQSGYLTVPLNK